MDVTTLKSGESAVLADGSIITRRFNGGFRVRGLPEQAADVQARFNPDQPRWPSGTPGGLGGKWRDLIPDIDPKADKLKLAGRVRLGSGERLVSTDRIRAAGNYDQTITTARIDTPTGTRLRLGVVDTEDTGRWSAADRGGTVNLDQEGIADLDNTLTDIVTRATDRQREYRQAAREYDTLVDRRNAIINAPGARDRQTGELTISPARQAELDRIQDRIDELEASPVLAQDPDVTFHHGVVPGDWGDLWFEVMGRDDEDGGWTVDLAVRPKGAGEDWRPDESRVAELGPSQVRRLQRLLERALTGVRAAAAVDAAAEVSTGAMVALLPSDVDVARLAVAGGEPADQLHVTLFYLGNADDFDAAARERIVDAVRDLAGLIPPGEVDGFAVAAFNPTNPNRDTAIVVELGGDGLEDVHGLVDDAVRDAADESGVELPDQHTPWRPHITLAYTDDLARVVEWADRTGPVRVDRIRVAFGGDHVDIPLTGEGSDDPTLDTITDDDMPAVDSPAEVEAQQSRRITRSDAALRRYWSPLGPGGRRLRWGTPGDFTRCVRALRRYVRDPRGLCATYHRQFTGVWPGDRRNPGRRAASASDLEAMTLPNPNPTIVHAAAQVSVDDVRTAFYRQAPERAWIREFHTHPLRLIVANDADGSVARVDVTVTDDGQITFSAPVPVRVEYVQAGAEAEESRLVYASAAESRPTVTTNRVAAAVSDRPWSDFRQADYTPTQWRRACLLDRGPSAGDEDTKARYGLPVREPDGTLNRNGVHAAAARISQVDATPEQIREAARRLVAAYEQIGDDPPDSLLNLAAVEAAAHADPPAAEPDEGNQKEDDMSLTEVRQRLGLADDADESTVLAAIDDLKAKADSAPDPQEVAAAAAENEALTQKVTLLQEQVNDLSQEVAAANAAKAAEVKASVINSAVKEGRIKPADREKWEQRYDAAPEVVTDVLASIAPGTAVPVTVQGNVGNPADVEATGATAEDDEFDRLFPPADDDSKEN